MTFSHHPFSINDLGHLTIGGLDTVDLAKIYGTPLFVYDVELIRKNCRTFVKAFKEQGIKGQVAYASKAFSSIAMAQVIAEEGLNLDVVSKGELYTAIQAGFPAEQIHFHGNNKSLSELTMALDYNIGCIVIDNFFEIELLEKLLIERKQEMDVLIRVTPGIQSETHRYIMTGNEDSKFGFNLSNGSAEQAFKQLKASKYINFKGIHVHIGSQIFEADKYEKTIEVLFHHLQQWKETYNYSPEVLNLGGGFGIVYTKDDEQISYEKLIGAMIETVKKYVNQLNIRMPEIWIEPGRSIVGNTGITLYTIGSMKNIPQVRKYVSVDGGMTDNLRPALYNAKYEGVIANKANKERTTKVSVAGKCCESGDMLIWDLKVPEVEHGDILAVFSTGAYGYSMANHYNRFPKPAVIFVENGEHQIVIQRETYKDVVKNDLFYKSKSSNKPL